MAVRSLWSQLVSDELLQFGDLDPETEEMLSELRTKLTKESNLCFQSLLSDAFKWMLPRSMATCC